MIGFGSLFKLGISEESKEFSGQTQRVQIGSDNLSAPIRGGRVWKGRAGTDDMQHSHRNVGDKESALRCILRSNCAALP